MIKWGEFREADVLFEAFLPEHEKEPCEWLVRASRRGHILAELRQPLTWPPRFGPDSGDVASVEALIDALITELVAIAAPDSDGAYESSPMTLSPAEPILHAMLHSLIEEYTQAESSLSLSEEQTAAYLGLPVRAQAGGLYPFAVTRERDGRMNRLIALDRVLKNRGELQAVKGELLSAVLDGDIPRLRVILSAAGLDIGSD
jgi:hypothetical protein